MKLIERPFSLERKNGNVFIHIEERSEPVSVVWARPISSPGTPIAFMNEKKKVLAMVDGLECLDASSSLIAADELARRYIVARIREVHQTRAHFGVRYWDVGTDLGRRSFAIKNAHDGIFHVTDDRILLRDTIGNNYMIESLRELGTKSQEEVEKMV